jgi:hypothetical protein
VRKVYQPERCNLHPVTRHLNHRHNTHIRASIPFLPSHKNEYSVLLGLITSRSSNDPTHTRTSDKFRTRRGRQHWRHHKVDARCLESQSQTLPESLRKLLPDLAVIAAATIKVKNNKEIIETKLYPMCDAAQLGKENFARITTVIHVQLPPVSD